MRWWPKVLLTLMVAAVHPSARAGTFDAQGRLRLTGDALVAESFDDPVLLVDRGVQLYDGDYRPRFTDDAHVADILETSDDALEGGGGIHIDPLDDDVALVGVDVPPLDGRVEVTVWTRAEPMLAAMFVVYSTATEPLEGIFASVTAIPTGRRTSDDWVELTTGPIDSAVFGVPLRRVYLQGGFTDTVVDALEVRRVGERAFGDDTTCTQATVTERCGEHGECLYGACVDSAAVWGAVPATARHRREYLDRLTHVFTRLHANRNAVSLRGSDFAYRLHALKSETSPRLFWGGIASAVHFFRDHHTSAPVTYAQVQSALPPVLGRESSGALGACFGLTGLDLLDGTRGYTVFRVDAARSVVGDALRVGDVLVKVDDESTDAWLSRVGRLGGGAPSDVRSEPAWLAVDLAGLITSRASTLEVLRCESSSSCAAPVRVRVEVQPTLREALLANGGVGGVLNPFRCDGRFLPSVTSPRAPPDDGSDAVSAERVDGVQVFQFDGFTGAESWRNAFVNALVQAPERALFDTRLGNGGNAALADFLVGLLRDQTSPQVVLGVTRPWHTLDPDGFYDSLVPCLGDEGSPLFNGCSGTIYLGAPAEPAVAATTRVAWVTSADVSANDFVPRLLQGRAGVRMFGPTRTSGAYGAIVTLPALLPSEYYGGSIQVHDSRFGASSDELRSAPYESGTGVLPDEIVVQQLSDALAGVDTLITRARAWLLEAP